jgi:hypothetical protein
MSSARPGHTAHFNPLARTEPFATAEEAWFWTMAALVARRDGARIVAGAGRTQRPCEPDDVVKCLDRLYRQRRIDLTHARILRRWGERQQAPDASALRERQDWQIWREALARLEWPLRAKGIVAAHPSYQDDPAALREEAGSVGATVLLFPGPRR